MTATGAMLLLLIGAGTGIALAGTAATPAANEAPLGVTTTTTTAGSSAGAGASTGPTHATGSGGAGGRGPANVITTPEPPLTTTTPPSNPSTTTTTTTIAPPAAPATGNLVDNAVEQAVVNSTWQTFSVAFAEGDTATMKSVMTTSAYDAVTGGLDCGCFPWPTAYTSVLYSAPTETAYPLSFWAEFEGKDYDNAPLTKEAVFTQASAASPWLLAYVGAFVNGTGVLSASGSTDVGQPQAMPVEAAANLIAQFGQQVDSTGNLSLPPSLMEDDMLSSTFTTTEFSEFKANGWVATWTHGVTDVSQPFVLSGADDEMGACFTLSFSFDVHSADGKPIVQPPDQSLFPPGLAPGSYASVLATGAADICFVDQDPVAVLTNYGGAYQFVGTPAP